MANEKNSTNKYKVKGLGQAFFPKGLRGARRLETESHFEKIAFLLSAVRRRYGQISTINPLIMLMCHKVTYKN